MTERIVLCGASGPVGRMLVPRMASQVQLSLVGRDPSGLRELFPDVEAFGYDAFDQVAAGADLVVNLTARNNDRPGSEAEFLNVNRDFALDLADRAIGAGVGRFVSLSSFHAADPSRGPYASSKAALETTLAERAGSKALVLRLPAVVGELSSGNLARVGQLPGLLRVPTTQLLSALRPTVSADSLADFILHEARHWPDPLVELADSQARNPFFEGVKRAMDLGFAIAAIVLLWWLFAAVWLAIKLESPGPGIFAQPRIGRDEQVFTCYKFRTMAQGTRQSGTHEANAASITRIGKWLRRTKIDELPQVLNLLRNEVSLVGPRPCLPVQEELVAQRRSRGVFAVKPGITGLAQVNDIDMSTPRLLAQWDRRYVMTRTLPLEVSLILATFIGRGQGDRIRH